MKAAGKMVWKMVKAYGKTNKAIAIQETGLVIKLMAMECILGSQAIGMKESGMSFWNMAKALIISLMETGTLECIDTVNPMAKESTPGNQELCTQENSKMERNKDMVDGRKIQAKKK